MQQINQFNINTFKTNSKLQKSIYRNIIIFALIASFVLLSAFRTFEFGNGSAMAVAGESPSGVFWSYTLYLTLISWLIFELIMRAYYFFVSLSMYAFVIPKKDAYYILRVVFAVRNILVASFSFLLFVSPIFINYISVITLIVDFLALVSAFLWIKKYYLGDVLAPFVWKSFLRPFVIFEIISVAFNIGGIL